MKVKSYKRMKTKQQQQQQLQPQPSTLMTAQLKETMDKALLNPLILHKIVNTLDFPELKLCRIVNRAWCSVSSEVMLKRDCSVLTLQYRASHNNFHNNSYSAQDKKEIQSLTTLNKILTTNFPCSSVTFSDGNLGAVQVQKFFKAFGHQIKTLRLKSSGQSCLTSKKILCKILSTLAPNVENLYLEQFYYTGIHSWMPYERIVMSSLKKFEWRECGLTALKILDGASNLQIIPDMTLHPDDIDVLIESGKASLLKQLSWSDRHNPTDLSKIAAAGLKLESMNFFPSRYHVTVFDQTAWENILNSSSETYESLKLSEVSFVPKLNNLKTLELTGYSHAQLFPSYINLQETFANLRILDCIELTWHCSDDDIDKLFPGVGCTFENIFPTVETLKINGSCSELWMYRLSCLCPNFKKVVIGCGSNCCLASTTLLSKIFAMWSHLEELDIMQSSHVDYWMDTAVTGMPAGICIHLRSMSCNELLIGYEKYITCPSILNLEGLKVLTIRSRARHIIPFSRVSGRYAFKFLPNLKVVVEFDHKDLNREILKSVYEEIAPYANVKHKKSFRKGL